MLENLNTVQFYECQNVDSFMDLLQSCTTLEVLVVEKSDLTAAGLLRIAKIPRLRKIVVESNRTRLLQSWFVPLANSTSLSELTISRDSIDVDSQSLQQQLGGIKVDIN